jgi:hypothetical protein
MDGNKPEVRLSGLGVYAELLANSEFQEVEVLLCPP